MATALALDEIEKCERNFGKEMQEMKTRLGLEVGKKSLRGISDQAKNEIRELGDRVLTTFMSLLGGMGNVFKDANWWDDKVVMFICQIPYHGSHSIL